MIHLTTPTCRTLIQFLVFAHVQHLGLSSQLCSLCTSPVECEPVHAMALPAEESARESSPQIPEMLAISERCLTSLATWAGQGLTRSRCRGRRSFQFHCSHGYAFKPLIRQEQAVNMGTFTIIRMSSTVSSGLCGIIPIIVPNLF